MSSLPRRGLPPLVLGAAILPAAPARAASRRSIDAGVAGALARLKAQPGSKVLLESARATLIFPSIIRGGFVFGGQYGNGALLKGETAERYYMIAGASFGLQLGAQSYGLAMFFMSDDALDFFRRSQGWEIGTGPSVVALDAGMAGSLTSTTLSQDVYAVTFGQQGLMASLSLEGTKISPISPD